MKTKNLNKTKKNKTNKKKNKKKDNSLWFFFFQSINMHLIQLNSYIHKYLLNNIPTFHYPITLGEKKNKICFTANGH